MDKLKCKPVMLLQQGEPMFPCVAIGTPELGLRYLDSKIGLEWAQYFHLYIVADDPNHPREIKEGDWMWDIRDNWIGRHTGHHMHPDYERAHYRRIEATTDPSLSLPLIPASFVQRWAEKQGKIEWVWIAMGESGPSTVEHIPNYDALLSSQKNPRRVTVLPTKDNFTREELKNHLAELASDLRQEKYGGCSTSRHIASQFMEAHGI